MKRNTVNLLIVGGGGREHALAWKLAQSPRAGRIYIAPGNAGCAAVGECVDLDDGNLPSLARWARDRDIGLVVPGPEAALCAGIADVFAGAGIKVFGPNKAAAELERSKVFAKNLMRRHGIPTADYAVFEQYEPALNYVQSREDGPVVVKADGLAAGKGAIVCENNAEAAKALEICMVERAFGEAGGKVVVEDFLRGEEVSVLALTDGATIAPLASAQDHKAVFDGDAGPNTGGMGAYSPAPLLTPELMDAVIEKVLVPTVHAMKLEGRPYKGVLYAGLMITGGGPKVLEFNVRFGDPETQPILARLDCDLLDLLEAVADGTLEKQELKWKDEAAVCVVMASGGYPGRYEKDKEISGLEQAGKREGVTVFHAGTRLDKGRALTSGGRVLGVTALGAGLEQAMERAYAAAGDISFAGAHYRRDIGRKGLARLGKRR